MGFPSFIARLFRREPTVVPPELEPMDQPIPETALAALQSAVWSPDAPINVEFCSGTPFWEDENYEVFAIRCMRGGCERWQEPFLYRLFLITGRRYELADYDRCLESWELVTTKCPDWPGLRDDRTTPAIKEQIEQILKEAFASL